eukprot:COSAG01_NODE_42606_length_438_cov_0.920354_1_plen_88_part_01
MTHTEPEGHSVMSYVEEDSIEDDLSEVGSTLQARPSMHKRPRSIAVAEWGAHSTQVGVQRHKNPLPVVVTNRSQPARDPLRACNSINR